ncbi:hypothetical protein TRIUR3_00572 [Triticum urartu]|uniref:Uncharacterized protein n=1 Tax=Triticum urartu TaxID=4572 RepID=M8A2L9_TRIUA|nr:hypothetical protein TRIUR3_00572 [Triticum urartu]
MSDEKRAEYNQKRRMARAHKKAASVISINPEEVSQTPASSSPDVPRPPLSNIANSNTTAATSAYTDHPSEDVALGRKKRSSETWYSCLSGEEKAEHCKKLRNARLEKKAATTSVQVSPGIAYLQTTQSVVSHMLNSPCSGSSMQTDGHIDWLHTNPTYERQTMDVHGVFDMSQAQGAHIQENFLPGTLSSLQMKEASSEKKRRRMREQYDQMTPEEKEVVLQRKSVHKMGKRHASSEQSYIAEPTGCHGNGEESYDAGILEPMEPPAEVDECLRDTRDGQPVHDDDDECKIFSRQGHEFESYRVTPNVSQQAFAADDPYDYVYKNLLTKHHVLKPVKDCPLWSKEVPV